MRPRIVEFLESTLHVDFISYIVPTGTTIFLASVSIGLWLIVVRGEKIGVSRKHILRACVLGVACGLVGARVFNLIQHLGYTLENPHVLLRLSGGTTSWGGYAVGTLVFGAYLFMNRQPLLTCGDLLVSCLGLGPFIGRWGCFMNGCCYGSLSSAPWAVQFPRFSTPHMAQVRDGLIPEDALLSLPVHPVQIYASLAGLILFTLASAFWKTNHRRTGLTFGFYWLLYCSFRFILEFFRGDVPRYGWFDLTVSQFICVGVITAAASWLLLRARLPKAL